METANNNIDKQNNANDSAVDLLKGDTSPASNGSEDNSNVNDICKDCVFWKQFKDKCWVHWKEKKFCTMKVTAPDDYDEVKDRYRIN
jgi:hypothetical protein